MKHHDIFINTESQAFKINNTYDITEISVLQVAYIR